MMGMAYYYCWDKRDDNRVWIVKARNADAARRLLLEHGEITELEFEQRRIRCAPGTCSSFNACGKTITRLRG